MSDIAPVREQGPGNKVGVPGDLYGSPVPKHRSVPGSSSLAKPTPPFCATHPVACAAAEEAAVAAQRVIRAATAGATILLTPSPIALDPPVPPVPMRLYFHRMGGGGVDNLWPTRNERKLSPPGISVILSESPAAAAAQIRSIFGPGRMWDKSQLVGSATIEDIQLAGFDVLHTPSHNLPNHYRLIHPDGLAGSTAPNLERLSKAFVNVPIP